MKEAALEAANAEAEERRFKLRMLSSKCKKERNNTEITKMNSNCTN
jgi:hypothetical protein